MKNNLYIFLLQDNINILKKIFELKINEKIDGISDLLNEFNKNNQMLDVIKKDILESESE